MTVEDQLQGQVAFYLPDQIPEEEVFGLEKHKLALENVLTWVRATGTCCAMLLFGWPGSAKTRFATSVVRSLNTNGGDWQYAKLNCQSLMARHGVENAVGCLQQAIDFVRGRDGPLLFVLDEIDAVAGHRFFGSSWNRIVNLTMELFQRKGDLKQTLLCGLTNYPELVDPAVKDHFEMPVYFALPDTKTIAGILEMEGVDVHVSSEVANHLHNRAAGAGARYSGRSLAGSCRLIKNLLREKALVGRDPYDLAEDIAQYANQLALSEVDGFELRNKDLIRRSAQLIKSWQTFPPLTR